ncbi:MAG: hypothetical protein AAGC60_24245 [Acidobacteriota bacterium]
MTPIAQFPLAKALARLLVGLLIALAALATAAQAEEVRRLEQGFFVGNATWLELDITLGSVRVEGTTDSREIEVEMIVTCGNQDVDRCRRKAQRLRLVTRADGDTLAVRVKGTPRGKLYGLDAEMVVRAPRNLALEIDLAGGDVFVEKMISHLEIDSAGGDVDVVFAQDRVRNVNVDVGVGKAELWLRDSRIEGRGFPRSIDWTGSGVAEIEIDLGGGDARVRLD